ERWQSGRMQPAYTRYRTPTVRSETSDAGPNPARSDAGMDRYSTAACGAFSRAVWPPCSELRASIPNDPDRRTRRPDRMPPARSASAGYGEVAEFGQAVHVGYSV